jgi:hypothetical protein
MRKSLIKKANTISECCFFFFFSLYIPPTFVVV